MRKRRQVKRLIRERMLRRNSLTGLWRKNDPDGELTGSEWVETLAPEMLYGRWAGRRWSDAPAATGEAEREPALH
jgi:hypothetical protein